MKRIAIVFLLIPALTAFSACRTAREESRDVEIDESADAEAAAVDVHRQVAEAVVDAVEEYLDEKGEIFTINDPLYGYDVELTDPDISREVHQTESGPFYVPVEFEDQYGTGYVLDFYVASIRDHFRVYNTIIESVDGASRTR